MINKDPDFSTVVHMLADAASKSPHAPALRNEQLSLTYGQYARCAAGFARDILPDAGQGDIVMTVMNNSISMAVAMLGTLSTGATLCTANPAYTKRELGQIISDCKPVLIVTQISCLETVKAAAGTVSVVAMDDLTAKFSAWSVDPSLTLATDNVEPSIIGILQYTGGTSGRSKGVQLTHAAVARNVLQRDQILPMRPEQEIILCFMPMFHSFSSAMCVYLAIHARGLLLIQDRYKPDRVLEALSNDGVTVFPAGPTVFIGLLNFAPFLESPPRHLRWCFSGSAALPEAIMVRWYEVTGCPIFEGYGQTEAGPILTYNAPGDAFKKRTVGRPLPETQIETVDLVTGVPLPAGSSGEIRARGPQLMSGYLNLPQETEEALRNGWLYTGDIGTLDEEGFLTIQDRKKDMVIVSGYNVYPREVDEVLTAAEGVAEAATVGIPDSYRGEVLISYLVAKNNVTIDVQDIKSYCDANLARYKVPREFRIVSALPKTAVGKIDRKQLAAEAQIYDR